MKQNKPIKPMIHQWSKTDIKITPADQKTTRFPCYKAYLSFWVASYNHTWVHQHIPEPQIQWPLQQRQQGHQRKGAYTRRVNGCVGH